MIAFGSYVPMPLHLIQMAYLILIWPLTLISVGGIFAVGGITLLTIDLVASWFVARSTLKWQKRIRIPKLLVGVAVSAACVVTCAAINGIIFIGVWRWLPLDA